jgi:glycosyltransferase involved in cell wall biosynthesis
MKQKLHVLGLPWTSTTEEFVTCAYSMKLLKFGRMMTDAGYDVILYTGEDNEAVCAEHVSLISNKERVGWFGEHDQNSVWGHISWEPTHPAWLAMNQRAIKEVSERAAPGDLLLPVAGLSQKIVADSVPLLCCEPFVGYEGVFSNFCAFESHAWRHFLYGKYNLGNGDGRWYDTVIPNYFDPDDFSFYDVPGDYLLFVGRVTARKNPHVAAQIAGAMGLKLIVAGPGVSKVEPGVVYGDGCVLLGDHVEYVGPVGIEDRADLMAGALALIAPTAFIEPFGGVAVEAMMSGTPAVTSDWGAFTETVKNGVSGFRFRTLAEGVEVTEKAFDLNRGLIRDYALESFSLEAVAPLFEGWFDRLDGLRGEGWSALPTPDMSGVEV